MLAIRSKSFHAVWENLWYIVSDKSTADGWMFLARKKVLSSGWSFSHNRNNCNFLLLHLIQFKLTLQTDSQYATPSLPLSQVLPYKFWKHLSETFPSFQMPLHTEGSNAMSADKQMSAKVTLHCLISKHHFLFPNHETRLKRLSIQCSRDVQRFKQQMASYIPQIPAEKSQL